MLNSFARRRKDCSSIKDATASKITACVQRGASPNIKGDRFGSMRTPLMFAVAYCDDYVFTEFLLKKGADPNFKNRGSDLLEAVQSASVAKLLLAYGAKWFGGASLSDRSVLHYRVMWADLCVPWDNSLNNSPNDETIFKCIVGVALVDSIDNSGYTPLLQLAKHGDLSGPKTRRLALILLSAGANPDYAKRTHLLQAGGACMQVYADNPAVAKFVAEGKGKEIITKETAMKWALYRERNQAPIFSNFLKRYKTAAFGTARERDILRLIDAAYSTDEKRSSFGKKQLNKMIAASSLPEGERQMLNTILPSPEREEGFVLAHGRSLIHRLYMYGIENSPYVHVSDATKRKYAEQFCGLPEADLISYLEGHAGSERYRVAFREVLRLLGYASKQATNVMQFSYMQLHDRRDTSLKIFSNWRDEYSKLTWPRILMPVEELPKGYDDHL